MTIKLRPYQSEIIDNLKTRMMQGKRRLLVRSPTGSGKTILTADMLDSSSKKGMNSFFIVHRRELVKQSATAFHQVGVYHGIVANGFPMDVRAPVQIASIQTLARRMNLFKPPKLIIWDECHHVAAGTWKKVFDSYPNAFHVGLTATPQRLDGKGLIDWFDEIVDGPEVSWLIENEFLSSYRLFAPTSVPMDGVKKRFGDFVTKEVVSEVDKPRITGSAIREYKKVADGKRAVVFCASRKHSKHVVDEFNAAGIPALHVDGETDIGKRDHAIQLFAEGEIKVLSNVDLFGEGFDLPAIEVVILLRPTQSLGLYLQQIGRALRPFPGKKEAIILDHVGNVERHGLPDEEREWDLRGRKFLPNKGESLGVKVCDNCFAAQPPGNPICAHCGYKYKVQEREIEEVDGELIEVDPKVIQLKRKREQGQATTEEELVELGIKRGYKRPRMWARHLIQARQRKRLGQ